MIFFDSFELQIHEVNENNIDVLGLRKSYYLKYPNKKYQSNILNTKEIEVHTNIAINRAGSIFEVVK